MTTVVLGANVMSLEPNRWFDRDAESVRSLFTDIPVYEVAMALTHLTPNVVWLGCDLEDMIEYWLDAEPRWHMHRVELDDWAAKLVELYPDNEAQILANQT